MSISLTAKVGAVGTITAGGGVVGTYLAWDRINYYEIERKVMKDYVTFSVNEDSTKTESGKKFWKISATGTDFANNSYSWDCLVVVKEEESASVGEDLKIILNKATGNTPDIRRRLVQSCSNDRKADSSKEPNNKEVHSKVDLSSLTTKDDVVTKLFGGEILNKVEKAVLDDTNKVYLDIGEVTGETTTIKAKSDDESSPFHNTKKSISWECILSSVPADVDKTKLKEKLPGDANDISNTTKKLNKKKLVYACSKNRRKNLKFPSDATLSNWNTQLLGE